MRADLFNYLRWPYLRPDVLRHLRGAYLRLNMLGHLLRANMRVYVHSHLLGADMRKHLRIHVRSPMRRPRKTSVDMVGNMRRNSDLPDAVHLRPDLRSSGHMLTHLREPAYLQWRHCSVSGFATHPADPRRRACRRNREVRGRQADNNPSCVEG